MPNKIGNEVTCSYCGKTWKVRSKSRWISCGNCLNKTRNTNVNQEDENMKPKIKFTIDGRVLTTRKLQGFDKGEITQIKKNLSKEHNVPEVEIMTEIED